jgi:hypothetical protein
LAIYRARNFFMALLHTKIPTHPLHSPAFWPIGDREARLRAVSARATLRTTRRLPHPTLPL